jgi:hypothetical protein
MTVGSNQSCGSAVSSIARALWAQMGNTFFLEVERLTS